jgi:hypothetical protein
MISAATSMVPGNYAYSSSGSEWKIKAVGDIEFNSKGENVAAATKAQEADLTILLGDYYGNENRS